VERSSQSIARRKQPGHVQKIKNYILSKYGKNNETILEKRDEEEENETVVVENLMLFYDNIWFAKIGVGSPAQFSRIILDTGCSLFWVRSTLCKTDACDSGLFTSPESKAFNHQLSRSFRNLSTILTDEPKNNHYVLSYTSGKVVLVGGEDNISFGYDFIIRDQVFGLAVDQEYYPFTDLQIDGVFGLGTDTSSSYIFDSPLLNMKNQNIIEKILFSYYITPNSRENVNKGEITFGGWDESKIDGTINWLPLKQHKFYALNLISISYGNNTLGEYLRVNGSGSYEVDSYAIVDIRTSSLIFPREIVKKLLNIAGGFMVPFSLESYIKCKDPQSLLSLELIFKAENNSSLKITLRPKDFIFLDFKVLGYCKTNIITSNVKSNETSFVLGESFLSNFYTIWNKEDMRFGIAKTL
jgi:hypothetical protein